MALATRTKIKRMLGINSVVTTYDDAIDDLLLVADDIIMSDLGVNTLGVTNYSETYSFDYAQTTLGIRHTPLVSVVALTMSDTLLVQDSDYFVDTDTGYIELKRNSFDIGIKTVEITYRAGFSSIPTQLEYASNLVAVYLFNQQSHVGFSKENTGNYSYELKRDDSGYGIPPTASRIINKYRDVFAKGMKR